MKMNNKGYASTIIMFSVLALFLVSMLMLIQTMNNSKSLNKNITDKVTNSIDYSAGGSLQTEIDLLKQQMSNLVDKMYPVGSIYMTTTYSDATQVHDAIGGEWEKYAQGRTIIGDGTGTDSNGLVQTFANGSTGGEYTHKLTVAEMPSHTHTQNPHFHWVGFDDGTTRIGLSSGGAEPSYSMYISGYTHGGRSNTMITSDVTATNKNTGGSESHNNVEPYRVTYIYKRVK